MNTVLKLAVAAAAVPTIVVATMESASAQMAMPDACKSEASASGDMQTAGSGMPTGEMAD